MLGACLWIALALASQRDAPPEVPPPAPTLEEAIALRLGVDVPIDDERYGSDAVAAHAPDLVARAVLPRMLGAPFGVRQRLVRIVAEAAERPWRGLEDQGPWRGSLHAELTPLLTDSDPWVRFWALHAAASTGMRLDPTPLYGDENPRVVQLARRVTPIAAGVRPTPTDPGWLSQVRAASASGETLQRATALRALRQLAVAQPGPLVAAYAASDPPDPALAWALMQVPDLPMWLDHHLRLSDTRITGAEARLWRLHQGWRRMGLGAPHPGPELHAEEARLVCLTSGRGRCQPSAAPDPEHRAADLAALTPPLQLLAWLDGRAQDLPEGWADGNAVATVVGLRAIRFPTDLQDPRLPPLLAYVPAVEPVARAVALQREWAAADLYLARELSDEALEAAGTYLGRPLLPIERTPASPWLEACARRAASPDVSIASGAAFGLLWSDARGAVALVDELRTAGPAARPTLEALALVHGLVPDVLRPGQEPELQALLERHTAVVRSVADRDFRSLPHVWDGVLSYAHGRQNHAPVLNPLDAHLDTACAPVDGLRLALVDYDPSLADRVARCGGADVAPLLAHQVLMGRDTYARRYQMDLFDGAAAVWVVEAIPIMARYATHSGRWPDTASEALGALGVPEAGLDLAALWRHHLESPPRKRLHLAGARFRGGDRAALSDALPLLGRRDSYSDAIDFLQAVHESSAFAAETFPTGWNGPITDALVDDFLTWERQHRSERTWLTWQRRWLAEPFGP